MATNLIEMTIKSLLLIVTILVLSNSTFGQYDSKGKDEATRFRPGFMWYYHGIGQTKDKRMRKYDRLVFDITYNDWTGDLKSFKAKPTSIGLGTNFIFDVPLTDGNTVSFGWGFNHHWTHIRHDETFFHNLTEKSTEFSNSQVEGRTSLNFHQLSVPLELRFHKEAWKHFKVHVGGKIGWQFAFNETTRLTNSEGKTIIKDYNFQDKNPLQYSAHLRLGLRNYAFFGEYNFSKLFTNSKSTQLNVLRLGVSISLF
jgi:hypothetical protein